MRASLAARVSEYSYKCVNGLLHVPKRSEHKRVTLGRASNIYVILSNIVVVNTGRQLGIYIFVVEVARST